MTIGSLTSTEQTVAIKEDFATNDVRTLVANHLGVSVGRVTDEAHFTHDLGADWLDRLELMMAVEDQFAGVEITHHAPAEYVTVGWLTSTLHQHSFGIIMLSRSRGEADQAAERPRGSCPFFLESWGRRDAQSHWLVPRDPTAD